MRGLGLLKKKRLGVRQKQIDDGLLGEVPCLDDGKNKKLRRDYHEGR